MGSVRQLIETVRPLSGRQVLTRVRHVVQRQWWRVINAQRDDNRPLAPRQLRALWCGLVDDAAPAELSESVAAERAIAARVAAGRFTFLNASVEFGATYDWHATYVSQLWRYHLHYFNYVRALLVAERAGATGGYSTFKRLVESWNTGNRHLRGDGWHPYTLSLRTVNWLHGWLWWRQEIEADPAFRATLLGSLSAQARLLTRQMEFDVRGNHLIENLRALLWLGLAFTGEEPRRWFDYAIACLEEETSEQILVDGGHFERTPGYHVLILRNYLEIGLLLERNTQGRPLWLVKAVRRQADFLRGILGPKERLPLVKDTAFDVTPSAAEMLNVAAAWLDEPRLKPLSGPGLESYLLLGAAAWRRLAAWPAASCEDGTRSFRESGIVVLSHGGQEHVFIDVGRPCPDYLPAHAHADTFSYEYHSNARPVVVDSGVYEYRAGVWRDYFRSTRAHNTLELDGANSSEVWGSFRVGRRARPRVRTERLEGGRALVLAEHDGYRHLPGRPLHRRAFVWSADEFLLIVDEVVGRGSLSVASHVHFHPSLQAAAAGLNRWEIRSEATSWWLHHSAGLEASAIRGQEIPAPQGWYSERFGERVANHVVALRSPRTAVPLALAYVISRYANFAVTVTRGSGGLEISVIGGGLNRRYAMNASAIAELR